MTSTVVFDGMTTTTTTRVTPRACWIAAEWILIPFIVFLAAEWMVRAWTTPRPLFWDHVVKVAQTGTVNAVFIGSSRVAAAIDDQTFQSEMSLQTGQPIRALNLGTGYSTLGEHWLGLRNLLDQHPEFGRSLVVFIEAPGGLPEHSRLSQRWHKDERPELLIQVLRPGDLPALWRSQEPLENRLRFTFRCLTDVLALSRESERIGRGILAKGGEQLNALSQQFNLCRSSSHEFAQSGYNVRSADLSTAGGIRVDDEGIQLSRQAAEVWAATQIADQQPLEEWNGTAADKIVRLVQANGGQVVFFRIPQHPAHESIFSTVTRQRDRLRFASVARQWKTPLLSFDFATSHDDFPDIWHLRRSRSGEFTRALCREWAVCSQSMEGSGQHPLP